MQGVVSVLLTSLGSSFYLVPATACNNVAMGYHHHHHHHHHHLVLSSAVKRRWLLLVIRMCRSQPTGRLRKCVCYQMERGILVMCVDVCGCEWMCVGLVIVCSVCGGVS